MRQVVDLSDSSGGATVEKLAHAVHGDARHCQLKDLLIEIWPVLALNRFGLSCTEVLATRFALVFRDQLTAMFDPPISLLAIKRRWWRRMIDAGSAGTPWPWVLHPLSL